MNLLVVHNCDHSSEGHHGEGVKDDIRRVDFEWYRLANLRLRKESSL